MFPPPNFGYYGGAGAAYGGGYRNYNGANHFPYYSPSNYGYYGGRRPAYVYP